MIIAPAKNILFGEHAAVYPPNTIIVAANNLECKAEAKKNNTSSTLQINTSGAFNINRTFDIVLLLEYLADVRRKYQLFLDSKDITILRTVISSEDDLLKLTIAVAIDYLKQQNINLQGFNLYLLSNVPSQSGFGSSAVFSSAVIAAILDCFEVGFDLKNNRDLIFDLTMEIENFQHGTPSGEGPAAVIFGGLVKLNKNETSKPKITRLKIKNEQLKEFMKNLVIVHSGQPEQTTGELVGLVRDNFEINKKLLTAIEFNTQKFLLMNEMPTQFSMIEEKDFINLINNNEELLEQIGVVSNKAKSFCAEIRANGGASKISGAGGIGDGGSGALLVYHSDREFVKNLCNKYKFEFFDIEFGSEGIRKV